MSFRIRLPLFVITVLLAFVTARSEEIPRTEYLRYVPLSYPRLNQQTEASAALSLFGDPDSPDYRDENPADGIDDERGEILKSLAVRFAPFLVQNTTNIPVNFDTYLHSNDPSPLVIDTWEISGEEPELVHSDSIDFTKLTRGECQVADVDSSLSSMDSTGAFANDDCRLLHLLNRFAPGGERVTAADPRVKQRPDLFTVLFFDFPGEGPRTWKKAYEPTYRNMPESKRAKFPHAYVHPLLKAVEDTSGGASGYELILQYWFFYPSNDGGNNHEGDWEHMNIAVSPLTMVEEPLSEVTVTEILAGTYSTSDDAPDPLVIKRVEYYFHHFVMNLDYSSPNVYLPHDEWKAEAGSLPTSRYQEREIWASIRYMAYADDKETEINTHPFGYIGADNKGLDQAMAMPGGKNRDSHGTYPFPGRYNSIGPAGATEQVSVHVDSRTFLQRLRTGKETMGPIFKRGSVLGLADPDRLRLVPDWERILELTYHDPQARREWSWLVLPIYFGYPATKSPFAGIVEHAETGNLPPSGPAYNPGWNVSGSGPGFHTYEPHVMPSVFPLGLHDGFHNNLGFLNLTGPVLFNLPPADFLGRVALYPFTAILGKRDPLYYPKDGLPGRFVSVSSGVSIQWLDDDYRALAFNQDQLDEFLSRFLLHLLFNGFDSTTTVTGGSEFQETSVMPFYQIAFYIGSHFASENTVRNVRSSFGAEVEFSNIPPYRYSADINYWEYTGSIRYSLLTSDIQPFVKGGYGWSWYRIQNVQANGIRFDPADSRWYKPGILPNAWHFGLGVEFVPWKRVGRYFDGIELAFRVEYARHIQNLGLDLSEVPLQNLELLFPTLGDVPGGNRVVRDEFLFGLSISF